MAVSDLSLPEIPAIWSRQSRQFRFRATGRVSQVNHTYRYILRIPSALLGRDYHCERLSSKKPFARQDVTGRTPAPCSTPPEGPGALRVWELFGDSPGRGGSAATPRGLGSGLSRRPTPSTNGDFNVVDSAWKFARAIRVRDKGTAPRPLWQQVKLWFVVYALGWLRAAFCLKPRPRVEQYSHHQGSTRGSWQRCEAYE